MLHTVGISFGYLPWMRFAPQLLCVLFTSVILRPRSSFAREKKASKAQHEIEQELSGQIWFNRIKGAQRSPQLQGYHSPCPGGCSLLQQPDVSTRFCKSAPGLIVAVCSRNQKVLPGCERHLTATRPESLPPPGGPDP